MDRKFKDNGPRRGFSDRREGRSDRFENRDRGEGRSDRFDRFDRFDRSDRQERSDRRFDRFDRADRAERSDRFERSDRRSDRREGFERREGDFRGRREGFAGRQGGKRFEKKGPRQDFGVRSGPRARALETRRFADRSDFAKNAMVRLDADIADYFENAEAVNKVLRMFVEASLLVKKPEPKAEPAIEPETAATLFAETDLEDDDETEYGEALELAEAEAEEAEEAEESAEAAEEAEEAEEAAEEDAKKSE